ncbi:MAG: hypothetical protein KGH75_10585 [Rhodospirillales bacterium]|nr:hypothetical protein [Rhodospirillales bacterium]
MQVLAFTIQTKRLLPNSNDHVTVGTDLAKACAKGTVASGVCVMDNEASMSTWTDTLSLWRGKDQLFACLMAKDKKTLVNGLSVTNLKINIGGNFAIIQGGYETSVFNLAWSNKLRNIDGGNLISKQSYNLRQRAYYAFVLPVKGAKGNGPVYTGDYWNHRYITSNDNLTGKVLSFILNGSKSAAYRGKVSTERAPIEGGGNMGMLESGDSPFDD